MERPIDKYRRSRSRRIRARLEECIDCATALDRYLAERESHDNCTMCGRPINGDPDMDGHYWTKHARYIDLCDDCGDDEEIER